MVVFNGVFWCFKLGEGVFYFKEVWYMIILIL